MIILVVQLPFVLRVSSLATEVSNLSAKEKEGKDGPDTAATKRMSKGGETRLKAKRVKQSKSVEEPHMEGKIKGDYHEEEDPAFSYQSSTSSDEVQSSTSSELGED